MAEIDTSQTAITRDFAGQARRFQLGLGEIGELERLCKAGIGEIMMRLASHRFYAADIIEAVRLGLEGGGETDEVRTTALIRRYLHGKPLSLYVQLAADILSAAVSGVTPDEAPGKEAAEGIIDPATSPSITTPVAPPA